MWIATWRGAGHHDHLPLLVFHSCHGIRRRRASSLECIGRAGIVSPIPNATKQKCSLRNGQSGPRMIVSDFYSGVLPFADKHLRIVMVGGLNINRVRGDEGVCPLSTNDVHIGFGIAVGRSVFHDRRAVIHLWNRERFTASDERAMINRYAVLCTIAAGENINNFFVLRREDAYWTAGTTGGS